MLDDLKAQIVSSRQLLQQLQSRAANLETAQALTTQKLGALRQERGETLRRATLELAIAELANGKLVKPAASHGPPRRLVSYTS